MAATTADWSSRSIEPTDTDLPLDVVYDLLRSHRRRVVLRHLHAESGSSTATELAAHVAAVESATPGETATEAECERVLVALTQCHLPKLQDAGVLEYDDSGAVELTGAGAEIQSHVPPRGDSTDASGRDTAAMFLAGCGVGAVGAVLLGQTDAARGVTLALLLLPITAVVAWFRPSID